MKVKALVKKVVIKYNIYIRNKLFRYILYKLIGTISIQKTLEINLIRFYYKTPTI